MRQQRIPPMITCRHCVGGFVDNPVYQGMMMRKERLKARVGLREVARQLGYSAAYLSDLELGRRAWNDDLVAAYDKVLKGSKRNERTDSSLQRN